MLQAAEISRIVVAGNGVELPPSLVVPAGCKAALAAAAAAAAATAPDPQVVYQGAPQAFSQASYLRQHWQQHGGDSDSSSAATDLGLDLQPRG